MSAGTVQGNAFSSISHSPKETAACLAHRSVSFNSMRAVARLGFLRRARIDRLEFAEARRHQMLRRNALRDEEVDDRDGARRGQLPVPTGTPPTGSGRIRSARYARRRAAPRRGSVGISRSSCFSASASFSISVSPSGLSAACPFLEQHFRLEHEAVAHDEDVGALRQDLPQPPEELGAVSASAPAPAAPVPN